MEKKRISVVGTGYVGLISAVCFAYFGHKVIALDLDEPKVRKLKKGISPIHEPGLDKMLKQVISDGTITFTTSYKNAVENSDYIFIAVGTPPKEDGSADLSFVESAYKRIARHIRPGDYKIIVNKSTVPVGTGRWAKGLMEEELSRLGIGRPFSVFEVVSNPEFLREGKAILDFMRPDRVVIGCDNRDIAWKVASLYEKLNPTLIITDVSSAEMIKYAANSFLATKISFINEIANICENLGADVSVVAKGLGLDKRISPHFLNAGLGFGGSCFPKDLSALINVASKNGVKPVLLDSVRLVNNAQKRKPVEFLVSRLNKLAERQVMIWGLAFKPDTDDVRESPAIDIITDLVNRGFSILAYDPVAIPNIRKSLPEDILTRVRFVRDKYEGISKAGAIVLVTDWKEFFEPDFEKFEGKVVFDGRNIWQREIVLRYASEYGRVG